MCVCFSVSSYEGSNALSSMLYDKAEVGHLIRYYFIYYTMYGGGGHGSISVNDNFLNKVNKLKLLLSMGSH